MTDKPSKQNVIEEMCGIISNASYLLFRYTENSTRIDDANIGEFYEDVTDEKVNLEKLVKKWAERY